MTLEDENIDIEETLARVNKLFLAGSYIPYSDTVREYCFEQVNWAPNATAIGALICNLPISRTEQLQALELLLQYEVHDEVLSTQIRQHLDWEKAQEAVIVDNNNGMAIYLVYCDGGQCAEGPFPSMEDAVHCGVDLCEQGFEVEKLLPTMTKRAGVISYKKDGKSYWVQTNEADPPYDITDRSRFENKYISVPNPFDRGDLVRHKDEMDLGVVRTSRHQWDDSDVRNLTSPASDMADAQIDVEFLRNGELNHVRISPLLLERVTSWHNEGEWELMTYVSMIMRGEGSVEQLIYYFDQYRNRLDAMKIVNNDNDLRHLRFLSGHGKKQPEAAN